MGVRDKQKPPGDIREAADLNLVVQSFEKCRRRNGSLSTDHYLCACNELIRLFRPLGRGFRIALSDISKAARILEIRRVSGAGCHCDNLDSLLDEEHERSDFHGKRPVKYGAKSLWKIYLGLEFIIKFLGALVYACEHDEPFKGQDKADIYQKTLGWKHSAFTQTTVRIALSHSGGKQHLLKKLEPSSHGVAPVCDLLSRCVEEAAPIQRRVGELLGVLSFDA